MMEAMSESEVMTETSKFRGYLNLEFMRKHFSLFALIGVFVGFSIANSRFFGLDNLSLILVQGSVLMIAAMGETFVILGGFIDLSVGSIIGIGSAITAVLGPRLGLFVFPMAGVTGMACGAVNGLMFSKGKIPSFVATLASLTMLRGIVYIITDGISVPITDPTLRIIGIGHTLGIPNAIIAALFVVVFAYYLGHLNNFGARVAAIGGAERVAGLSGIYIDKMKIAIFVLCGFFAGISGSVLASRMGAGSPYAGFNQELDVIAAVVMGGTALTGGLGGIRGTVIGTMIIAMLSNGLNVTGVDPYTQMVVKGIVLWIAVLVSMERGKVGIIK
jgi:ribose/xylose/arabinose/galactoside ABC-type transport system permease subunit